MSRFRIFNYQTGAGTYYSPRWIAEGLQEVEVILSGRGLFKSAEGEWLPAFTGSMLWFQSGEYVEAKADAGDPYNTCVFVLDMAPRFQPPPRLTEWRNPQDCQPFCQRAFEAFQGGFANEPYWRCLEARLHWEALESAIVSRRSNLHPALLKALDLINGSYRMGITVEEIAEASEVSAPHLHLLFRTHLGTSPGQLLMKLRLDYAQNLLRITDKSVKEICGECAFPDPGNFGAVFKRRFGMTPLEFRRRKT
jgi:AraC-like DNA-binding protein